MNTLQQETQHFSKSIIFLTNVSSSGS